MSVSCAAQAPIHDQELGLRLPKYLHCREGVFYFKRKIPAQLHSAMIPPKKQVWKSLQTEDFCEAVELLRVENEIFEEAMNDVKFELSGYKRTQLTLSTRGQGTTKYLLDEHIPFVVARYRYMQLMQADEERSKASPQEITEQRAWVMDVLRSRQASAGSMDYRSMEETAEMMLHLERLNIPPNTDRKKKLMQYLLAAEVDILKEHLNRLDGLASPEPLEQPMAPREMPTMKDAFEAWKAKRAPDQVQSDRIKNVTSGDRSRTYQTVRLHTVETYERYVREFENVCGELPIEAITSAHVNLFRDYLIAGKLVRPTVKNHIGGLAAMLRASSSTAKKFKAKTELNVFDFVDYECVPERSHKEKRRAYEASEMAVLFQSPIYTQRLLVEGQCQEASYWVPLMSPFAGPRIEELAQLRMEDIKCINEVWTLRIANLWDNQEIKTPNSFRLVPIHKEIIRCGFLVYAAKQKRAGHQRVFPSLSNDNKRKKWSNALGKWYSRYLDTIGLNDKRLCHHSFRFNFAQQLVRCGIDNLTREALMGHWLTTQSANSNRQYIANSEQQYPFEALVNAIRNLNYEALDLSHLYVDEPEKDLGVLLT
ncbi:MAG: hypothetical protein RJA34_1988 [Pseudomonadota bacterium]